jgi:hypothetical protein
VPLAVAAVGAALVWVAARWWVARTRPLIYVAMFVSAGALTAADEASALQYRIMDSIESDARHLERPGVIVKPLGLPIDVRTDRAKALRRARSSRAAVVIAGSVRSDPGETHMAVHVLTRDQAKLRPIDQTDRTMPFNMPIESQAVERAHLSADVARLARLALGLALMQEGRLDAADTVLAPNGQATDALMRFYGALVAYLREDHETARIRADASFAQFAWAPI